MRSDLESGMPATPPQSLYQDSSEALPQLQARWQQGIKGRQRPSSTLWHLIVMSGDIVLLVALFGLLILLHLTAQLSTSSLGIREVELIWICLALVSWSLAVNITQSQNLNYVSNRFKSPCCTLFALMLTCIFWMLLSHFLLDLKYVIELKLELFFLGLAIPAFTIWRFLLAEVMGLPGFRLRAVIVGANTAGEIVAKELRNARHTSIGVLGYIAENPSEQAKQGEVPILGDRSVLHYLVHNNMIDMIIMALDYGANPALFKEATDAAQLGISVLPMAVVYENSTGRIPVEHVGDQWYVALQSEHLVSPLYLIWKKALDLACAIIGLLILCPLLPIIALLIYIDSPGPIFYSQERVGFRGKVFRIYKFRTMRPDAEQAGRPVWAAQGDKRVTRVGRFLRSTHLDEVPQLYNILRGDMSLIGPRPERAEFIKELEKTIPFYGHRLAVKPGLTGWAQVKYRYGRTDNDALIKLQYDLYYIKRQSFMLDLFIILNTVIEVLYLRGV